MGMTGLLDEVSVELRRFLLMRLALVKTEGRHSFFFVGSGILVFSLGILTVSYGFFRLINAAISRLSLSWSWSPAFSSLIESLCLFVLGIAFIGVGQLLFKRAVQSIDHILSEVKEDIQCLKKII